MINSSIPLDSLALQLSAQCNLQKTWDLNGHPVLCMFLADDLGVVHFSQYHTTPCLKSSSGIKGLITRNSLVSNMLFLSYQLELLKIFH
jgi:hypothetical protein